MSQRESQNHHFVPRSLLKHFSVDGLKVRVHVFDKRSGRSFTPSIENAGSENGFNKANVAGGTWNFEHLFDDVDAQLHGLLQELHASRRVTALSLENRRRWADMVAVQLVRTPLVRSTLVQSARDLANAISESGLASAAEFVLPWENDSKLSAVELLLKRDNFREALEDKDLVLFEPAGTARFVVSDHPVVRQTLVPYGGNGLRSPGVAVYLPVGPDLLLGMMCRSTDISLNARPIELLDMEPASADALIALREGLRTGSPIRCPDVFVESMNEYQAANCARFVYSHQNDFLFVRALLEREPELKEVKTQIRVGRLGEGLPIAHRMPEGQWLVLFGAHSHYMIEISDWSSDRDPIEASTVQVDALERAIADSPFSEVQIFQDRRPMRMMRDVRVDIVSKVAPVRIRIRCADSSMEALNDAIARCHS